MIKTVFKLVSMLLVALSICIFASSCHGARETVAFEVPSNFDASKEYNITFWAKNENNSSQRSVYDKAIEDFEKLYPNIKVTIKHYTSYDDIYNDVITNIKTGTTPNVCITYPDHIATYITGDNIVVPLNDLVNDPGYGLGGDKVKFDAPTYSEMVEDFMDECYIGDRLYAMPYMRSTEVCYVNKTYVEALGFTMPEVLTWDFIWEVSAAAMEKNPDGTFKLNGQKVMIPCIYKSTDNMMIQMLSQLEAGYSTDKGDVEIFNDTTREILKEIAKQAKAGTFSTFKISSYPGNYLNRGQCIFAIDSTAGATWMGSNAPLIDVHESEVVEFETAVMTVPQCNPDNIKMISQGPSLCIFNKEDSSEVMASWLFLQYLLTNETQIAYSQTEGYLPVTTKAQNDPAYLDYISRAGEDNQLYYDVKIASAKLLMDNIDKSFTTAVFNGSTSLRNAAGELIEDVTKASRRKKNVNDKYIDSLYESVTSLYRLDQIEGMTGKIRLREMPPLSIGLLSGVAVCWIGIGLYVGLSYLKKKKLEGAPKERIDTNKISSMGQDKIKSIVDLAVCEVASISFALIVDTLIFFSYFESSLAPTIVIIALTAISVGSIVARKIYYSKLEAKKTK